jgi:radical SAM protein with 4Fe4S-binding SPASM domain
MNIFQIKKVAPHILPLLLHGRFDFEFELLPYRAQGISKRKALNFFLAGLNQYLLPPTPLGYPVIAQVEPANICNLSCPLCLTSSITKSRAPALLPFETFQRFIDECGDYLLQLIFWGWGEPFLNPEFSRMVAYAKTKGIIVHTSTNGNIPLDEAKAAELVDSGLDSLVVAVDGATEATYQKYRQGGNLETVLSNLRTILKVRSLKGLVYPKINMRFVVMSHNEHEIPAMRTLARQLGVDYFTLKTVDMPSDRGCDLDRTYLPQESGYRRYEYAEGTFTRKQKPFVCMRPWKRITLDASGEIIPCEYDYRATHSFGNIMKMGTIPAWKSAAGASFRKAFHRGSNDFYLCRNCTYKNRVAEDCTIERFTLPGPSPRPEKRP